MTFISTMDIYLVAVLIYFLRIVDVSIGTIRTISIVAGRRKLSFVLGFFEVFIWVMAVSQVIVRVHESYFLAVAYALGFATGNVVGICLERVFSVGNNIIRIFSEKRGDEIAELLNKKQYKPVVFQGRGDKGPLELVYVIVHASNIGRLINTAREIDPQLTYVVEPVKSTNVFRTRKIYQT